jgi:hypothetical protein
MTLAGSFTRPTALLARDMERSTAAVRATNQSATLWTTWADGEAGDGTY